MKSILLWLSLATAAAASQAQTTGKPLMLVASPALQGLYSRTTLIAIPAGERRVAFIVNRAPKPSLATLLPSHAAARPGCCAAWSGLRCSRTSSSPAVASCSPPRSPASASAPISAAWWG